MHNPEVPALGVFYCRRLIAPNLLTMSGVAVNDRILDSQARDSLSARILKQQSEAPTVVAVTAGKPHGG